MEFICKNIIGSLIVGLAIILLCTGCGENSKSPYKMSKDAEKIGADALEVVDKFLDHDYDYDKAYDKLKDLKNDLEIETDDDKMLQIEIIGCSSTMYTWHLNAARSVPLNEYQYKRDWEKIIESRNSLARMLGEEER